ncbi:MAG TPA: hypothetical protein VEU30_05920 [Thermoanaerobaculia bacterium]|nr:hypothetical protein [Thermoanaerobaculia bacterium]
MAFLSFIPRFRCDNEGGQRLNRTAKPVLFALILAFLIPVHAFSQQVAINPANRHERVVATDSGGPFRTTTGRM